MIYALQFPGRFNKKCFMFEYSNVIILVKLHRNQRLLAHFATVPVHIWFIPITAGKELSICYLSCQNEYGNKSAL